MDYENIIEYVIKQNALGHVCDVDCWIYMTVDNIPRDLTYFSIIKNLFKYF